MGILQIFTLLGALGMFLYGMNLMSSGLQKAAGDRLRGLLSAMTSNPFKGVLTGLGITSVIQSSSATTVMVVSSGVSLFFLCLRSMMTIQISAE